MGSTQRWETLCGTHSRSFHLCSHHTVGPTSSAALCGIRAGTMPVDKWEEDQTPRIASRNTIVSSQIQASMKKILSPSSKMCVRSSVICQEEASFLSLLVFLVWKGTPMRLLTSRCCLILRWVTSILPESE